MPMATMTGAARPVPGTSRRSLRGRLHAHDAVPDPPRSPHGTPTIKTPDHQDEDIMRPSRLSLPLALALVCAAGLAAAQTTPTPTPTPAPAPAAASAKAFDMTGTWTGTSKSIVSGLPVHHPVTSPPVIVDGHRLTEVKFKVVIDGQEDRRFWGNISSAARVEQVIGVIAADGRRVRMVGQGGGLIEGTVLEDGTLELFYVESRVGVSVAATNLLTREKK